MASKNERELKVCALSGHNYKPVPSIRLMGQWLEAAGFHIGDGGIREACCGGPEEGCPEGRQDRKAADRKHGSEEDWKVFQDLGGEKDQGNVRFHPERSAF